jgi:hypothetical protein
MLDPNDKRTTSQAFHDYMLLELQLSVDNSKRIDNRSEKVIDLFLALFTALAGGGVVVLTTVQDRFLASSILALDLILITGIGILTYVWVLVAIIQRHQERIIRYHIQRYFQDLDPAKFEKYGRGIVLNAYRTVLENRKFILKDANFNFARSVSLLILVIFNGTTAGGAMYAGWVALVGSENILLSIAIGILCVVTLIVMWGMTLRSLQKSRVASQKILINQKNK